jgi:hypothetical protein
MVTLSAEYLNDLGRVRLTAGDLVANVSYILQRSTDADPDWVDVRGGGNVATTGVTVVDDYEYIPNVANHYRLIAPVFYDSFNRTTVSAATWGTADTGQSYVNHATDAGATARVDNGVGIIEDLTPSGNIIEQRAATDASAVDAVATWSAVQPDPALDVQTNYNIGLRSADQNNYYECQLLFESEADSRDVRIQLAKRVAGVFTGLTSTLRVGEWTANIPWYAMFRVFGSSLMCKAWPTGADEPRDWQLFATDTDLAAGSGLYIRARKASGAAYEQWYGPIEVRAIPDAVAASTSIIPVQTEVWLKSVAYPLFNWEIECTDWDALTYDSRVGLYDIKGRHEILAITDVGSSGSFGLTFVTRSAAANRSVLALLTYGGVLLLQPPGDVDEDCPTTYEGIPDGYVVPTTSVRPHSMRGQPLWVWQVSFTQVAAMDTADILPTTITWQMLWALIGDGGTWEDVWEQWDTWQELWLTQGNIDDF